MESIESIGQKMNTDNNNINTEGRKLIDNKFEKIWTKETDVLNSMIRDINAGRDRVIGEYWSNIVNEYRLLFKPEFEKTYSFLKLFSENSDFFLNYREFSKAFSKLLNFLQFLRILMYFPIFCIFFGFSGVKNPQKY